MIKLIIVNKNGYEYDLRDENGNNYNLNLEFLDIEKEPENEDYLYINSELLNEKYEGYSTSYTFGSLENKYGKEDISMDDIDVIKVVIDKKEIFLKRLYG